MSWGKREKRGRVVAEILCARGKKKEKKRKIPYRIDAHTNISISPRDIGGQKRDLPSFHSLSPDLSLILSISAINPVPVSSTSFLTC